MTAKHSAVLNESEFNELRDFLAAHQQKQQGFNLIEAHGYMTGLICGFEVMHPTSWILDIFNGEPEYASDEQKERINGYLCRMYNNTAKHIRDAKVFHQIFYPLHPKNLKKNTDLQSIRDWLSAFIGAAIDDDWMKVPEFQMIVFPIIVSSQESNDVILQDFVGDRKPNIEAVRQDFFGFITPAIFNLYRYLVNVKNRVDISMFEDEMDDETEVMTHDCHDCGVVH
jgi:uncharacterized protein